MNKNLKKKELSKAHDRLVIKIVNQIHLIIFFLNVSKNLKTLFTIIFDDDDFK